MPDPDVNLWYLDGGSLHYDNGTARMKWTQHTAYTRLATGSPWGGPCAEEGIFGMTFDFGPPTDLWIGSRFKIATPTSSNTFNSTVSLIDFDDGGVSQVTLFVDTIGRLGVRSPGFASVYSIVPLHINRWYYFEAFVHFSLTAGMVTIRLNGVEIPTLTLTSVNTAPTSGEYCTNVWFGDGNTSMRVARCDTYIHKTQFLGDMRIGLMRPNDVGTYNDWLPSPSGDALWETVDDIIPDLTDYAYVSASGSRFTCNMEDVILDPGAEVLGIQVLTSFEKTDAGDRRGKTTIKDGTAVDDGAEHLITALGTPVYARKCYERSPDTDAPFTEAQLNAIEAGGILTK